MFNDILKQADVKVDDAKRIIWCGLESQTKTF